MLNCNGQVRRRRVDEVEALIARITEQRGQLLAEGIELSVGRSALRGSLGRSAIHDAFHLLQDRNNARDTVGGCRQGLNALIDLVFASGQILRAVGQRLRLEERNRVIGRRSNRKTGSQMALRRIQLIVDVLKGQQVSLRSRTKDDIGHALDPSRVQVEPLRSPARSMARIVPPLSINRRSPRPDQASLWAA